MCRFAVVFFMLLPFCAPSAAEAQAGIRVFQVEGIRVDGSLRDWRGARFTPVGHGPDASMRFALGHDDEGLYLAAQVWDDRLVRTPHPGSREDAVILTLAIPHGRRRRAVDLYFFAGVTGRSAASAGIADVGRPPRPLAGARVVEGPLERGRGYTLEAFVPFRSIPGGSRWDEARGSIRLRDVDSESHPRVESEPSLVTVDRHHLERLVPLMPSGGASGALEQFLASRGLDAARPSHRLHGDVGGDQRDEEVFVVDRYVVVTGPGYREGGGYAFHQLPVDSAGDVRSARLRDLTGDRKEELILVLRQRNAQGERDIWQVLELSGGSPRPLFGIEVRKAIGGGWVQARVNVERSRGRRPPVITDRAWRAHGLDAESYREAPASDVESMLVPWGPVLERRYRWSGQGFERIGERENPRYTPPSEQPERQRAPSRARSTEATPAPAAAPSLEDLLAEFRRRRGIPRGARARFSLRANLAGGREPETVRVYGRQLVVVGPGVHDGRSWLYYGIPAASDADVLNVQAADVTGDHRAELLFTVRQTLGDVRRQVLLVHQLTARGFPRLLSVEVAREQGRSFVRNVVQTRGGHLEILPGRARGFSAANWPFAAGSDDSVQPLLLPWRDRPVRYRYRHGRLERRR